MNEMQPVEVLGLYLDPTSGSAMVLLGEAGDGTTLGMCRRWHGHGGPVCARGCLAA
jgi:hypothetical protein